MASYTEKLKLLKKDPILDGDDTFNIETMLNENWDKIDEKVGELDDKSTNIKAEDIKLSDGKTVEAGITEALNKADQAFQSASDGKTKIATAITGKGVPTSGSDTFQKMATNINAITTDPSIGTTNAAAADILLGKKAISQGQLITGTIPIAPSYPNSNIAEDVHVYAPGEGTDIRNNVFVMVPKGYYDGVWLGYNDPALIASNIKAGVGIGLGKKITGTAPIPSGNAVAQYVLSGYSFSNANGVGLNGAMPNNGAINGTITTQGGSIAVSSGYTTGGMIRANFANNIPSNIKKGVNIGGVVGDYNGGLSLISVPDWMGHSTTIFEIVEDFNNRHIIPDGNVTSSTIVTISSKRFRVPYTGLVKIYFDGYRLQNTDYYNSKLEVYKNDKLYQIIYTDTNGQSTMVINNLVISGGDILTFKLIFKGERSISGVDSQIRKIKVLFNIVGIDLGSVT